jgi:hypothetical protein
VGCTITGLIRITGEADNSVRVNQAWRDHFSRDGFVTGGYCNSRGRSDALNFRTIHRDYAILDGSTGHCIYRLTLDGELRRGYMEGTIDKKEEQRYSTH